MLKFEVCSDPDLSRIISSSFSSSIERVKFHLETQKELIESTIKSKQNQIENLTWELDLKIQEIDRAQVEIQSIPELQANFERMKASNQRLTLLLNQQQQEQPCISKTFQDELGELSNELSVKDTEIEKLKTQIK